MSICRPCCRLRPSATTLPLRPAPSLTKRRKINIPGFPSKAPSYRDPNADTEYTSENNPIANKIRDEKAAAERALKRHNVGTAKDTEMSPEEAERKLREKPPDLGKLSKTSIINSAFTKELESMTAEGRVLGQTVSATRITALDPKPAQRRRWERKMVIREVQRRGRLSKAQIIKRTERALTTKSPMLKTSMKKLNPLANQIAGKTIEDAIVQMRYSVKKSATVVREQLEAARDQAIVERGMGLGAIPGADHVTKGLQTMVRLKDGKLHKIKDRTGIYVDQAWTGKGAYGQDRNPRARGRVDRLRLPQTSISIVLKEEATRIREHRDRKEREEKRKIWTPLPDRPITGQRQYYCW